MIMNYKYINNNYYYFKNQKLKNKIVYSYIDKFLKDSIYVVNSGLISNSFLREKQMQPSVFSAYKKISLYKKIASKFDIFAIYPTKYIKNIIQKERINQLFFSKFYFRRHLVWYKLLKKKRKVYFRQFKNLMRDRVNVNKRIFKKWKKSYYVTYTGHVFSLTRRFVRLNSKPLMFRDKLKPLYRRYVKIMFPFLKNLILFSKLKTSDNKVIIYKYYSFYLYKNIMKRMNIIRRLKKSGPFYPYFKIRKKNLPRINTFLKKYLNVIIKKKKKNMKIQVYTYNHFSLIYLYHLTFCLKTIDKEDNSLFFIYYLYNSYFYFDRLLFWNPLLLTKKKFPMSIRINLFKSKILKLTDLKLNESLNLFKFKKQRNYE